MSELVYEERHSSRTQLILLYKLLKSCELVLFNPNPINKSFQSNRTEANSSAQIRMRVTLSLIVLVVVLFGSIEMTVAQFDEICHFECANVYCDPYTDYCDYDCYEVCYPYRTLTNSRIPAIKLGVRMSPKLRMRSTASPQPVARTIQQHGTATSQRNGADSNKLVSNANGRTGKGIHMRIQRVPRLHQDANAQAREFQRPENFALLDTCLSD